jgi:hypothetical protein
MQSWKTISGPVLYVRNTHIFPGGRIPNITLSTCKKPERFVTTLSYLSLFQDNQKLVKKIPRHFQPLNI